MEIVIIGGGAAGLMAAYSAAEADSYAKITVVEKNSKVARKVMITGKGRCNVTNACDVDTLIRNIPRNPRFLYSAFSNFDTSDTMDFFKKMDVPLKVERGNRVFPVSDKAVDVVDALFGAVRKKGVKILNDTVCEILVVDGAVRGVRTENSGTVFADRVLVATGGVSYPVTGSTGDGHRMATELGHTVTELSPSLVPLECHEGFCTHLSGLSLKNVTLSIFEEGKKKPVFCEMGEMLFTHFGISGPLVLSGSAYIKNPKEKSYKAFIDLKPALTLEQLDSRILRDFSEQQNRDFSNSLDMLLPKSLIPIVVSLSGISAHQKVNSVDRESRKHLCELLKAFPLNITGFRPIEEAIITRGGISVKEINPATMESKFVSGLFFAGELIDVDAFTGGFNLQIAFSTGFVAGKNMIY